MKNELKNMRLTRLAGEVCLHYASRHANTARQLVGVPAQALGTLSAGGREMTVIQLLALVETGAVASVLQETHSLGDVT